MKTAAIYARRSKIVETGDSIENQITLCTNYLKNIGITNVQVYADEGFSGKNTDRPNFIKLINDAKEKKFDVLICYKLDRVSRNICDFSNLINDLDKYNISFISVSEQFDTSNAIGTAMMYICSVFSQLERQNTSQRVCDNMYNLASMGYWLGGTCPLGFINERKSFVDQKGITRTYSELKPVEEEIKLVKLIFEKYIEFGSLSQVEKYLLQNNIKTRKGKDWSKNTAKNLLTNPVYVKADDKVSNYLKSSGIALYGEIDNLHGLLIYKKRKGKNGKIRDVSEWIYAVSNHEGIIDSDTWLEAQKISETNKVRAPTLGCSHNALLSGMIRCANCGTFMRVAYGNATKSSNTRKHYYMCTLKHNSGTVRCSARNIDGPELDRLVINKLKEMSIDKSYLIKSLKSYRNSLKISSENFLQKNLLEKIQTNNKQINNIVNNISLTDDPTLAKMLITKLEDLKNERVKLDSSLSNLNEELETQENLINDCNTIINKLKNFSLLVDSLDIESKRKLLSSIIDKVFVNGDTGAVKIKFKTFNKK